MTVKKVKKEFDLTDVRKYHKITELVVLNQRKKELMNKKIGEMKYEKNIKNMDFNPKK